MLRKLSRESILLTLLITVTLLIAGTAVNWHRLPVDALDGSLNDQVGYVGVGRNLAEHGTLDSNLVYPVLLRQQVRRTSLYMPGYYWALAAVYKCFGYSAVTSRLPSLVGLLLSAWLTFLIGDKLYNRRAAALGCTLFAVFPLGIVYAFTAMVEQLLVAAALAAFAMFIRAGERARLWVSPLVLVLPVLFRETGAIVGVVMLAVMVGTGPLKQFRRALVCALLMAAVVAAVLLSPVGAGRPSLWKANLLLGGNSEAVYGDAFATDNVQSRVPDLASAIRVRFASNLDLLFRPRGDSSGFFEQSMVWFILSGIPLGFVLWVLRRDPFALGTGLAIAVLFLAVLALYSVWGYRGMRVLLVMHPFAAIVWGAVLERIVKVRLAQAAGIVVLFSLGTWGAVHLIRSQSDADAEAKTNTAFLESVVRDKRSLLASPFWLSFDYVNEHYPQKWSFVPGNCETARLLDQRYRIGTLVIPVPDADKEPAAPSPEYCGTGLKLADRREFDGTEFLIYRRQE